jgi:hypothetical protein
MGEGRMALGRLAWSLWRERYMDMAAWQAVPSATVSWVKARQSGRLEEFARRRARRRMGKALPGIHVAGE